MHHSPLCNSLFFFDVDPEDDEALVEYAPHTKLKECIDIWETCPTLDVNERTTLSRLYARVLALHLCE